MSLFARNFVALDDDHGQLAVGQYRTRKSDSEAEVMAGPVAAGWSRNGVPGRAHRCQCPVARAGPASHGGRRASGYNLMFYPRG